MSEAPARRPVRRFPGWIYAIAFVIILMFTLAPVAAVTAASLVADANGCELHEGFANPCIVGGVDRGDLLYSGFVMGWFMLATIPLGFMAFLVWLAVLIIHQILHKRSARQ